MAFLCQGHPCGGAGDGARTRDIQLGRLALYQLSYPRLARATRGGAVTGSLPKFRAAIVLRPSGARSVRFRILPPGGEARLQQVECLGFGRGDWLSASCARAVFRWGLHSAPIFA